MLEHSACPVDNHYAEALEVLATALRDAGEQLKIDVLPEIDINEVMGVFTTLVRASTSPMMSASRFPEVCELADAPDDGSQRQVNAIGSAIRYRYRVSAHESRLAKIDAWRAFFLDDDIVLCPAAASVAPPFDDSGRVEGRSIFVNGSASLRSLAQQPR